MPSSYIACSACRGSGRVWKSFFYLSWRFRCKVCRGSGQIETFDLPKPRPRVFGQRETPPQPVTPSYVGRPTVSVDQPLMRVVRGDTSDIAGLNHDLDSLLTRAVEQALAPEIDSDQH